MIDNWLFWHDMKLKVVGVMLGICCGYIFWGMR